jgi:hypothetical protein
MACSKEKLSYRASKSKGMDIAFQGEMEFLLLMDRSGYIYSTENTEQHLLIERSIDIGSFFMKFLPEKVEAFILKYEAMFLLIDKNILGEKVQDFEDGASCIFGLIKNMAECNMGLFPIDYHELCLRSLEESLKHVRCEFEEGEMQYHISEITNSVECKLEFTSQLVKSIEELKSYCETLLYLFFEDVKDVDLLRDKKFEESYYDACLLLGYNLETDF